MHNQAPKVCGADIELGNFIAGQFRESGSGCEASRRLLNEIDGLPIQSKMDVRPAGAQIATWSFVDDKTDGSSGRRTGSSVLYDAGAKSVEFDWQDQGRRFLPTNGGCVYIDLDHLELCLPEVRSAYDHVACWHAMLRLARRAQVRANAKMPEGQHVEVLINNSDGLGHSYGSHLNFLITRDAWGNLFNRRLHYMLYLAAYQASSIIFTGQGKVGSENGAAHAYFQISQRADFMETLAGTQTTYRRPVVNTRDEPHCGMRTYSHANNAGAPELARLHVIFYDNTLAHAACLLKVGVMQIILSMIEAECVSGEVLLEDPRIATLAWSHDPELHTQSQTVNGRHYTAAELQLKFIADATTFVAKGGCDGVVPEAERILTLWADTVEKLHRREFASLTSRLDWVLKREMLQRTLQRDENLSWNSPSIRMLDFLYGSLDPQKGLYWAYEQSGALERVVPESRIAHFENEPPEDTRAWTRAMLLRAIPRECVTRVSWDHIAFSDPRFRQWSFPRTIELANPLHFGKNETGSILTGSANFDELLERMDGERSERQPGDQPSTDFSSKENAARVGGAAVPKLHNAGTPHDGA